MDIRTGRLCHKACFVPGFGGADRSFGADFLFLLIAASALRVIYPRKVHKPRANAQLPTRESLSVGSKGGVKTQGAWGWGGKHNANKRPRREGPSKTNQNPS